MGGVGNQLFQYAFAAAIAQKTGIKVALDVISGFRNDPYGRRFALDELGLETVAASGSEVPANWRVGFGARSAARLLRRIRPSWSGGLVFEIQPYRFDEKVFELGRTPRYFYGYWQHARYFEAVRGKVRNAIGCTVNTIDAHRVAMEIAQSNAVSIHVRTYRDGGAGSTLAARTTLVHGACDAEYYEKALSVFSNQGNCTCFVFSDVPEAAREMLSPMLGRHRLPARYVSASDLDELRLMSLCRNHIIANSSFSWWGAWLGDQEAGLTIAPRTWMQSPHVLAQSFSPQHWRYL